MEKQIIKIEDILDRIILDMSVNKIKLDEIIVVLPWYRQMKDNIDFVPMNNIKDVKPYEYKGYKFLIFDDYYTKRKIRDARIHYNSFRHIVFSYESNDKQHNMRMIINYKSNIIKLGTVKIIEWR
jgi:hypothetical protein